MTPRIKSFLSVLTLSVFLVLGIASSPKNGSYSDGDKWIPADFDPSKGTLLVERHPLNDKQNDRMIKWLDEHYPNSYEVVNASLIKDTVGSKYTDLKKYKFAILWRTSNTSSYVMGSDGRGHTQYAWDMYGYFLDRSTGKEYKSTGRSNVYGQIGYRPVFNTITKKFK